MRLTIESSPAGLRASLGSETVATPFTRDVIVGSSNSVAVSSPQSIGTTSYDFTSWSDGGARAHNLVAPATDTTYRATFTQGGTVSRIAGSDVVGSGVSEALPGGAEVYRTTATAAGRATALRLHLAPNSTASALVLGMYSDSGGEPQFLLGSGRISAPVAGQWAEVQLSNGPQLVAGQAYWISLLNPSDATGTLRWHDRAGGGGGRSGPARTTRTRRFLGAWTTAASWSDGPLSGYVMGTTAAPPAPSLSVTPASLSFSATQGGANPAAKTLSVANTGGGTLSFTDSDDASWLTVTPASGTRPARSQRRGELGWDSPRAPTRPRSPWPRRERAARPSSSRSRSRSGRPAAAPGPQHQPGEPHLQRRGGRRQPGCAERVGDQYGQRHPLVHGHRQPDLDHGVAHLGNGTGKRRAFR